MACKREKGDLPVRGTGRAADGRNGRTPKCGDGRGENRWLDRRLCKWYEPVLAREGLPSRAIRSHGTSQCWSHQERNSREQVEVSHATNRNATLGARSAERLRGLWAHCRTRAMLEVGKGIAATMRGVGVAVCSGVLI